ncbi:hypothetical protein [Streptomyces sp. Z26]|uniref:hypothetical protein n=1 Tax=Streptomyces sp. Z26 TaxID=2500177 RepID=UPI001F0C5AAE|nr:hypothetical protein [Streptomyces sp. Z26]
MRDVAAADLNCSETVAKYHDTGTVNVYNAGDCGGAAMCKDVDNDKDYSRDGDCTGSDNDRTSSAVNLGWSGTNDDVRFYFNAGYNGYVGCLGRGKFWSSMGTYDDRVSSHKWANC